MGVGTGKLKPYPCPAKRRIRRRSCTGKKRYTTAPEAQAAIISSLHPRKGYRLRANLQADAQFINEIMTT